MAYEHTITIGLGKKVIFYLFLSEQAINKAVQKPIEELSVGVLDIYGFEIFQVNILSFISYPLIVIAYYKEGILTF